ncbi:hypothetical protein, partial [Klebsiella pneumoniae]|uniref:hypothetical protein n=1 Tax=Klebsiella pneumoniae TaxID=573 RepID=UPI0013D1A1B0
LLAAGSDAATARLPGASRDFYERLYDSGKYRNLLLVRPDGRISFRLKPLQELGPQANSLDEAVFAGSPLLAVHQQALRGPVARLT